MDCLFILRESFDCDCTKMYAWYDNIGFTDQCFTNIIKGLDVVNKIHELENNGPFRIVLKE